MIAMAPAQPTTRTETVGRAALLLVLVGIAVRLLVAADPHKQNVYLKVFAPAAEAFAAGRDLYALEGGYRYPPLAAALVVPFAWCGPLLGSILWRLGLWLGCVAGLASAFRCGFPFSPTSRERGVFLLLLLPSLTVSLNNGQPNVLIVGWSLLASTAFLRRSDGSAAWAVTGSTVFKVYPLAYGLVLATLRPRLLWWLVLAVAIAGALPFALQDVSYVRGQYGALVELLQHEDRTGDLADAYRDLRLLGAAAGLPIPAALWLPLQATGGAAIVVAGWRLRRRGCADLRVLDTAFALTSCWFLLLGPATEKATYVLLAPAVLWALQAAWRGPARGPRLWWGAVNLLFFLDHVLPGPGRDFQAAHPWVRCALPLAALLAAIGFAARAVADLRCLRCPGVEPNPSPG